MKKATLVRCLASIAISAASLSTFAQSEPGTPAATGSSELGQHHHHHHCGGPKPDGQGGGATSWHPCHGAGQHPGKPDGATPDSQQ